MKKLLKISSLIIFLILFIQAVNKKDTTVDSEKLIELIEYTPWYISLSDSSGLSKGALFAAHESFLNLKHDFKNDSIITIVDYSKPSYDKRLYVIDIKNQKLLAQSLVAHGQNSGLVYAENFSNRTQSHMSSLGMYMTSNTYSGKHGYSLRLNGLDKELNDKACVRAIVIHGADYVSEEYIKSNGRIGRSFGCPALPQSDTKIIIDLIKEGSCFYVYHPTINNS